METLLLVEPEDPANTGLIARLCQNFNNKLECVNPKFNMSEAIKTSSKGERKLRDCKIYDNVEKATQQKPHIIGTKPGKGKSLDEASIPQNSCVMIGRESNGLSNKELEHCDQTIHINTGNYSSLNQSHAAAIISHKAYNSQTSKAQKPDENLSQKFEQTVPPKTRELVRASAPSNQELERIIGEWKNRT